MTRTLLKTASAAILAATLGLGALTAPATAGGQISIGITPTDPEHEQALKTGLGMFALFNNIKNGGVIQNGNFNSAGLAQNGSDNLGIIVQEGNGHNGTINQTGDGNTCGLFQFGENTTGDCSQTGGQTGAVFQFGF